MQTGARLWVPERPRWEVLTNHWHDYNDSARERRIGRSARLREAERSQSR